MKIFLSLTIGISLANLASGGTLLPHAVAALMFVMNVAALMFAVSRKRRSN